MNSICQRRVWQGKSPKIEPMLPDNESRQTFKQPVVVASFIWGLMAFMPVGVNYAAFFLLWGVVLMEGQMATRWHRLGHGIARFAGVAFLAWSLVVLCIQSKWYAESASNLWHVFRIPFTLFIASTLSWHESRAALTGFLLACTACVAMILGSYFHLTPTLEFWAHLTNAGTNKTIGASILMSMAFGVVLAQALYADQSRKWRWLSLSLVLFFTLVFAMLKRTAMVDLAIAVLVMAVFSARERPLYFWIALSLSMLFGAWLFSGEPGVPAKFAQGVEEVRSAFRGEVTLGSWNVRIQMLSRTYQMILEEPLWGWGIGSWNEQWRLRVPQEIAEFNMPHNDALWMGAQAGVLGGVLWMFLMLSQVNSIWKIRNAWGASACAAIFMATFSSLVNNGTRDATIGLPMLWMVGVLISLARESAVEKGSA